MSKSEELLKLRLFRLYEQGIHMFTSFNWPLCNSASLVATPCRSVYIAHKTASEGVSHTPSDTILWAIYSDLHVFATRSIGAELESGQLDRKMFGTCSLCERRAFSYTVQELLGKRSKSQISVSLYTTYPFPRILKSYRPRLLCVNHPLSLVTSLGGDNWAIMGVFRYVLFYSKIWNNYILAVILWNNNYRFERSKYNWPLFSSAPQRHVDRCISLTKWRPKG